MSPVGGDALQAPECTQTLSHRGAAQPERARHRALCERERKGGGEPSGQGEGGREREQQETRDGKYRKRGGGGVLMREGGNQRG